MKWYDWIITIVVGGAIGWFTMDIVVDWMGESIKSGIIGVIAAIILYGLFGFGYVKFTFWRDDK